MPTCESCGGKNFPSEHHSGYVERINEYGELYRCRNCGWYMRYVLNNFKGWIYE